MLLEPVLIFDKTEYVPSNLIILTDNSESMDLRDAYADQSVAAQTAKALKLAGVNDLRQMSRRELGERALGNGLLEAACRSPATASSPPRFCGATIDRRDHAADHTAGRVGRRRGSLGDGGRRRDPAGHCCLSGSTDGGILLLTDGQSNTGESPAKAAELAAAEVCRLSVGAGHGRGAAHGEDHQDRCFAGGVRSRSQSAARPGGIARHGPPAGDRGAGAGEGWRGVGRNRAAADRSGRDRPTANRDIRILRRNAREAADACDLEGAGPELQANDHSAITDVRAIRDKIKVLFVAGETFPEVEFIRAMLLRDNAISASTWLQTADADYEQPGTPRLKRLPETADELNDFDCIILYDPDPSLWPADYPQLLTDFVAKAGGGLVYVAGERNTKDLYDRPDDPAVSWLNLLPVMVEPGLYHTDVTVKLSTQSPWKLEITPEGKSDPIFTFSDRPEDNETILSSLPGMFWYFPVTRARPGATVLRGMRIRGCAMSTVRTFC